MIPAIAAPMTARPPTAPPTAAPIGNGFGGDEDAVGGFAVAEPTAGPIAIVASEPEEEVPAAAAKPGGAAVPVDVAVIVTSSWVLITKVLVAGAAIDNGLVVSVTPTTDVAMLVTTVPDFVSVAVVVVGFVTSTVVGADVRVDVVETMIYVDVTPQLYSEK